MSKKPEISHDIRQKRQISSSYYC